jgi:tRNA(Ile)-lysidine synthase
VNLPERLSQNLATHKLFPRGGKMLIAVSGGVDSMALLHALHALAPAHGWQLAVAHFNHQLRGRASDGDEKFVRTTAEKLGLKFFASRGNVTVHAARKKISLEMAARELRHAFLARTARRVRAAHIALAHHADDQVELFFLRLLRGSGGDGLAGMKWLSPSPADAKIKLVRPLLNVSKAELETFVRENKIRFREDASNRSPDFLRNRVRRELLPLLREHYQPALGKTILRAMEIIGAETEFVADSAVRAGKTSFAKSAVALQRRQVQRQLLALGVEPSFELIEWLRAHPGQAVTLDARRAVTCDAAGRVRLQAHAPAREFLTERLNLNLAGRAAGKAIFAGRKFSWAMQPQLKFSRPQLTRGVEFFDADKVGGKIILRHWRAGDRFQPSSMASPVKLQDLFVNAKIPAARRRALVVATTARGEIFWVEGLRMSERFKLTPATRRKLRWHWR